MQQNKWSDENYDLIKDLIKSKEEILKNIGTYVNSPYITGMINYVEVRKILTECECYHDIKTSNDEIVIYNVERNPKLYDKSKMLYFILELYGKIIFLEHI